MKGADIKSTTAKRVGANMKKGLVLVAFVIIGGILASYAESARADIESLSECLGGCERQMRAEEIACHEAASDCLEWGMYIPWWTWDVYESRCLREKDACQLEAWNKERRCRTECHGRFQSGDEGNRPHPLDEESDAEYWERFLRQKRAMEMWEKGYLPLKD
jgi:hypothetical protein